MSAQAFEEVVDENQDSVLLADEVTGMDVVHADARRGVRAFDLGLDGPDAPLAEGRFRIAGKR